MQRSGTSVRAAAAHRFSSPSATKCEQCGCGRNKRWWKWCKHCKAPMPAADDVMLQRPRGPGRSPGPAADRGQALRRAPWIRRDAQLGEASA
eukprot:6371077-Pyramimonas_sp.AAC.1